MKVKRNPEKKLPVRILNYFASCDPVLHAAASAIRLRSLARPENYFSALAEAIISQQLSNAAAETIIGRFRALIRKSRRHPHRGVLKISAKKLRNAGISAQKAAYIQNLAKAVQEKRIDFQTLIQKPDNEVIGLLTSFKGIGQWTAEMFLIFSLRRPDVFSFGDLGLRNALDQLYGRKGIMPEAERQKIVARWSPYRSYAARVLWASRDRK